MRAIHLGLLAATCLVGGCVTDGGGARPGDRYGRYDWNRPDPAYGGYYADRYYRNDPRYREHRLTRRDRVYRGQDGRYYCRRSDGTTGLIVGGIAGGVLGNLLASGHSETLGTLIGAAAGAAVGAAVDQGNVRCR